MQTIGFLGPAFFLSQLSGVTSVPAAVACMMGAQGLDAFSQAGLYSNHQDIGPRCVVWCGVVWRCLTRWPRSQHGVYAAGRM